MADVLLVTEDTMARHDPGLGHPERPERLQAVIEVLRDRPVTGTVWGKAPVADRSAIEAVHAPAYVRAVESLRGKSAQLDPDTATSPGSVEAAFLAAGAAIDAVDALFDGRARRSFALVRPPGHHAESDQAMGFCFFNNIAIATEHARRARGCERVLIVDWDVHHGNGTQHTFEERSDVLVFNTHRFPFYPGTGALGEAGKGAGEGFTVNAPLPGGMEDGDYAAIFQELLLPVAERFRPDLVLVSAGFDAHRDDPLADMQVSMDGFAHLCGVVRDVADRLCGGRISLVLEGGYDLTALAESVRGCVAVLAGAEPPPSGKPDSRGDAALSAAVHFHRQFWSL